MARIGPNWLGFGTTGKGERLPGAQSGRLRGPRPCLIWRTDRNASARTPPARRQARCSRAQSRPARSPASRAARRRHRPPVTALRSRRAALPGSAGARRRRWRDTPYTAHSRCRVGRSPARNHSGWSAAVAGDCSLPLRADRSPRLSPAARTRSARGRPRSGSRAPRRRSTPSRCAAVAQRVEVAGVLHLVDEDDPRRRAASPRRRCRPRCR